MMHLSKPTRRRGRFLARCVGIITFLMMYALLPGCETPVSRQPVTAAQTLDDWSDDAAFVARDGQIYFSGQPTRSDLQRFAELGGRAVINLRPESEMASVGFVEAPYVQRLGMDYINIPITPDTLSTSDIDRLSAALDSHSGPILIHCSSSNRTGGVWAAYLVRERGYSWNEALELGRAAGLRTEPMIDAAQRVASAP